MNSESIMYLCMDLANDQIIVTFNIQIVELMTFDCRCREPRLEMLKKISLSESKSKFRSSGKLISERTTHLLNGNFTPKIARIKYCLLCLSLCILFASLSVGC